MHFLADYTEYSNNVFYAFYFQNAFYVMNAFFADYIEYANNVFYAVYFDVPPAFR